MEYFKHDINASEDDKICELLAREGYEMLGYYWRFIEYLYSRDGKLPKDKINSVAWALHMDCDKLNHLIYAFGLFREVDECIISKRVLMEVENFAEVGRRMSEIGKAGGKASAKARAQADAKRMVNRAVSECLSDSQADAQQKKRKEKKRKEKKIERMNEYEPCETHDRSINHSKKNMDDNSYSLEELKLNTLGGIGQNVVFLSDMQIEDLLNKMSLAEFDRYVKIVAESELNGKHYKKKTHYQAILDMVENDRMIKQA